MKTGNIKLNVQVSIVDGDAKLPVKRQETIDPYEAVQDTALSAVISERLRAMCAEATEALTDLAGRLIECAEERATGPRDPAQSQLPGAERKPRRSRTLPRPDEPTPNP